MAATLGVILLVAPSVAPAHELSENRATLIRREDRHLSMTLYLNYPEVLRRILSPQQTFAQFVVAYSALAPEAFKAQLGKAQADLQGRIRVVDASGKGPKAEQWRWPDSAVVQGELRLLTMQILTAPGAQLHDDPVEIQADFLTERPLRSVRASFPRELQPVLVVSYSPKQVWATPEAPAPQIQF